ncbi:MAG: hypothetical protein ACXWPG_17955 [Ktedonobacteraceae bacterium]
MNSDEVERLVREFIKTNPHYTNNSFSIDLEETVQVIPGINRLEDLKEMRNVPSDAQWLAVIDEQGNIRDLNGRALELALQEIERSLC